MAQAHGSSKCGCNPTTDKRGSDKRERRSIADVLMLEQREGDENDRVYQYNLKRCSKQALHRAGE